MRNPYTPSYAAKVMAELGNTRRTFGANPLYSARTPSRRMVCAKACPALRLHGGVFSSIHVRALLHARSNHLDRIRRTHGDEF